MPAFRYLILAACLTLAACTTAPRPLSPAEILRLPQLTAAEQRGHDVAVRRCSGCHTVGRDDGGAGDGPSFRKLSLRYNPISLERRFAEVSQHGFDRMPPVEFTRSEAEDLVAYVNSLPSE